MRNGMRFVCRFLIVRVDLIPCLAPLALRAAKQAITRSSDLALETGSWFRRLQFITHSHDDQVLILNEHHTKLCLIHRIGWKHFKLSRRKDSRSSRENKLHNTTDVVKMSI